MQPSDDDSATDNGRLWGNYKWYLQNANQITTKCKKHDTECRVCCTQGTHTNAFFIIDTVLFIKSQRSWPTSSNSKITTLCLLEILRKMSAHTKMRIELESPGTSWNHLEWARSPWNKTQKQEIHKKDLCMQHHCPTESTIGNSYCHKKHISDVCRWNHLERNGTNNDLTQIKTFIGHYYVYNIISLQEHFTNNYCYKEFHLMWRQGVPDLALHYIYFK